MAVAATGFFDGVHLGHSLVLRTLLSEAERRGEQSLIITFWPHPRVLLQDGARDLRLLTSLDEKKSLLSSLGVDRVEVLPFSREFASMSAEDYLRMLKSEYGVSEIVAGYDTRIGSDLKGPGELESIAAGVGLDCKVAGVIESEGDAVSSTKIRKALAKGAVREAAQMLGRPYMLKGIVVSGNQLGRTIGFPTANMKLCDPLKLIPGNGVYLTRVSLGNRVFDGMTNVGYRPTVGGSGAVSIETNILDFDEMIYGCEISLAFIRKIRDERKFDSLEALSAQLAADRDECRIISLKDRTL